MMELLALCQQRGLREADDAESRVDLVRLLGRDDASRGAAGDENAAAAAPTAPVAPTLASRRTWQSRSGPATVPRRPRCTASTRALPWRWLP